MRPLVPRAARRRHLDALAQAVVHLTVIAPELLDTPAASADDDGLRSPTLHLGRPAGTSDPTTAAALANVDRPAGHLDAASPRRDLQDQLGRHLRYLTLHTREAMRLAYLLRPDLTTICRGCRRPFAGSARDGQCDACYRRGRRHSAGGTGTAGQTT